MKYYQKVINYTPAPLILAIIAFYFFLFTKTKALIRLHFDKGLNLYSNGDYDLLYYSLFLHSENKCKISVKRVFQITSSTFPSA